MSEECCPWAVRCGPWCDLTVPEPGEPRPHIMLEPKDPSRKADPPPYPGNPYAQEDR